MKCEPIFKAVEDVQSLGGEGHVVFLSPSGKKFDQEKARELSKKSRLILLCGHYEGIDERIREHLVDEEISIGDFVLTNGAIPALVVIDGVVRLIPGVVGNEESTQDESFSGELLEAPQYTRPEEFRGWKVPEILLSGDHGRIKEWRQKEAVKKTKAVRPDLIKEK
jgi:tRNA (guanine37-N1)-methyltransferase